MKRYLLVKTISITIMEPFSESSSDDESDYSLDGYEYYAPPLNLPRFLNSDYKWNKHVQETDSMQGYSNLIGRITNFNIPDYDKYYIMFFITQDIVQCHKHLNPHWKLLQQHALFSQDKII